MKGASQALGLQSVAGDLGLTWSLNILTDSTAAIGICRRKGLGKIRHLHVGDLWVQDRLKSGDFKLEKVLGTENCADMLTKYLDGKLQNEHIGRCGMVQEDGRAESAPKLPANE